MHEALGPAVAAPDELADRQRIQELVGEQDHRAGRQILDPVVPRGAGQRGGLDRAQPGRGLDQVHAQRRPERRRDCGDGAQRVGHQRAAAGPGLGQDHRVGAAHRLPGDGGPGAQDLPEGLADLGRGGEVGERVVGGVVLRRWRGP